MDRKKLLSMAILGVLITTRFSFGLMADLTKTSLDSVDNMASYFSGVKLPNTISETVWNEGQKVTTKTMNFLQKSVKEWGSR